MAKSKNVFGKKVDIDGIVIHSLPKWKKNNPRKIFFDSRFEWKCYIMLKEAGFNFKFHPEPRIVQEKFNCLAFSKNTKKIFNSTVRSISYTPDFLIHCDNGAKVYVEAKGYFHEDARLRYKLFQRTLTKDEFSFIIYDENDAQMKSMRAFIDIIKMNLMGLL